MAKTPEGQNSNFTIQIIISIDVRWSPPPLQNRFNYIDLNYLYLNIIINNIAEGISVDGGVEIGGGNEDGGGRGIHGVLAAREARGGRGQGEQYMGRPTPMAEPVRIEKRHS